MKPHYKEITIPITREQILKMITVGLVSLFVYLDYYVVLDYLETPRTAMLIIFNVFFGLIMVGLPLIMGNTIYNWELNIFHRIGYCLRLKQ